MRDSATYQAILDEGRVEGRATGLVEGRVEEARELLLALGTRRFGVPDVRTRARIAAIGDLARLHTLAGYLLDAVTWDDLLARDR